MHLTLIKSTVDLRWKVHCGDGVLFWRDVWVREEPLHPRLPDMLAVNDLVSKVEEYWQEGVGWKWIFLQTQPSATDMVRIASISLSHGHETDSSMGDWIIGLTTSL